MNNIEDEKSSLIFRERDNTDIVIGVPHHAPAGIDYLPCKPPRPTDENAGYLGIYIADKLGCCYIVACCYQDDVNKNIDNDYSRQIIKWAPKLYVEIHGHHCARTNNDVEISCGSLKKNEYSLTLAKKLRKKCHNYAELNGLKICGDFNTVFFKAISVATVTHPDWIGFLIELPPELRYEKGQKGGEPPKIGYVFCDYVIESLKEIWESWNHL